MDFPNPEEVPVRRYRAERYLDPDGLERVRYVEDPDFDRDREDAIYNWIMDVNLRGV